jgi:geranylgeranyl pyrophosphate synthase
LPSKAINSLLHDPALNQIQPYLEFISKNWFDPLRPALIKLACGAVGGNSIDVKDTALAMSLMNMSYYLWDDIIDKAPERLFKPTTFGQFGESTTIILGGLASAKAFTILNQAKMNDKKRKEVFGRFWDMWAKMALAEIADISSRGKTYSSKDKLRKIETEASANLENCLKIGAILGGGRKDEVKSLGRFGYYLGIILELQNDVKVSLNLSLELGKKIKFGSLPYLLLLAKEKEPELQKIFMDLSGHPIIAPAEIAMIVERVLASQVLDEIESKIEKLFFKAVGQLGKIKRNSSSEALECILKSQLEAFAETLHSKALRS